MIEHEYASVARCILVSTYKQSQLPSTPFGFLTTAKFRRYPLLPTTIRRSGLPILTDTSTIIGSYNGSPD